MVYCARILFIFVRKKFFLCLLASFPLLIDVCVDLTFSRKSGVRIHGGSPAGGGGATSTARLNSHEISSRLDKERKTTSRKNLHQHFFLSAGKGKKEGEGGWDGLIFSFAKKNRKTRPGWGLIIYRADRRAKNSGDLKFICVVEVAPTPPAGWPSVDSNPALWWKSQIDANID